MATDQDTRCSRLAKPPEVVSTHDGSQYLGLAELSRKLLLSPRSVRTYIHQPNNPLPAYLLGRKYLFLWSEVQAWIQRHRVETVDTDVLVEEITASFKG